MPDKHIDITFFNGSIRNCEQEHMAKVLRAKSKTLVAFGSCAHEGCVPGLANLNDKDEIFEQVYIKDKSNVNPKGTMPQTSNSSERRHPKDSRILRHSKNPSPNS